MIGRRSVIVTAPPGSSTPGQLAPLEELQRGAAAGREVIEGVLQPRAPHCQQAVPAADDAEGLRVPATASRDAERSGARTARARTRPSGRSTGWSWRRRCVSANSATVRRADVEPLEPRRDPVGGDGLRLRVQRRSPSPPRRPAGSTTGTPRSCGPGQRRADVVEAVGLHQASRRSLPRRRRSG